MLLSSNTLYLAGNKKLKARLLGPFRVLERIRKTAYRLDLRRRSKGFHNVFYVSQLKRHIHGGSSTSPPEPIQVKGEEHFELEALLQHRSRGNS